VEISGPFDLSQHNYPFTEEGASRQTPLLLDPTGRSNSSPQRATRSRRNKRALLINRASCHRKETTKLPAGQRRSVDACSVLVTIDEVRKGLVLPQRALRIGLENYTFLTSEMAVARPSVYAGRKRQFFGGISNVHQNRLPSLTVGSGPRGRRFKSSLPDHL